MDQLPLVPMWDLDLLNSRTSTACKAEVRTINTSHGTSRKWGILSHNNQVIAELQRMVIVMPTGN